MADSGDISPIDCPQRVLVLLLVVMDGSGWSEHHESDVDLQLSFLNSCRLTFNSVHLLAPQH